MIPTAPIVAATASAALCFGQLQALRRLLEAARHTMPRESQIGLDYLTKAEDEAREVIAQLKQVPADE